MSDSRLKKIENVCGQNYRNSNNNQYRIATVLPLILDFMIIDCIPSSQIKIILENDMNVILRLR